MQYRHTNYDMTDKHIGAEKSLMLVDKRTEVGGLAGFIPGYDLDQGHWLLQLAYKCQNDFIHGKEEEEES